MLHQLNRDETIVTDPATGGKKGAKLARFSLVPPEFLWALAELYGKGAAKYAERNWEKGYKWSLTVDALERHLALVKMGEWMDAETGCPHIICVAWHAAALFTFYIRGIGTDDLGITAGKPAVAKAPPTHPQAPRPRTEYEKLKDLMMGTISSVPRF